MKSRCIVAITRPASEARVLAKLLRKAGVTPYVAPTVEPRALPLNRSLAQEIKTASCRTVHYWIFMSVRSVNTLLSMAQRIGVSEELLKNLKNTKIIAVGPSTANALRSEGIRPVRVPNEYSTRGLVSFFKTNRISRKMITICRSKNGDATLSRSLRQLGNRVWELRVYESAMPSKIGRIERLIRDVNSGRIAILTFTSAQSVKNFFQVAGDASAKNSMTSILGDRVKVAAIGVTTARCLRTFGIKNVSVPRAYTIRGLAEQIQRMIASR